MMTEAEAYYLSSRPNEDKQAREPRKFAEVRMSQYLYGMKTVFFSSFQFPAYSWVLAKRLAVRVSGWLVSRVCLSVRPPSVGAAPSIDARRQPRYGAQL